MGNVIYSAGPLQVFIKASGTILFIVALGIIGMAAAILQRSQQRGTRLLTGAAGGVLVIAGIAYAALTFTSAVSPTHSVALKLDSKQIAEDNCGNNGGTCTRYVLEATTASTAYDFNVSKEAYDRAQVNGCYQFTFYANNGLFGLGHDSYQRINNVSRIEAADPAVCQ